MINEVQRDLDYHKGTDKGNHRGGSASDLGSSTKMIMEEEDDYLKKIKLKDINLMDQGRSGAKVGSDQASPYSYGGSRV